MFDASLVAQIIRREILASDRSSRRMRLRTLLRKVGMRRRNLNKMQQLSEAMAEHGLQLSDDLKVMPLDEWLVIEVVEKGGGRHFEGSEHSLADLVDQDWINEKEVEIRFVVPLLRMLGYNDTDRADGHRIEQSIGSSVVRTEADFVLFDGASRSFADALMVVEVKAPGSRRLGHAAQQARSYAMHVGAPLFLVTNGNETRLYVYRGPHHDADEIFRASKQEFCEQFVELRNLAGKDSVTDLKTTVIDAVDKSITVWRSKREVYETLL